MIAPLRLPWLSVLSILAVMALPMPAVAAVISGSFSGTAFDSVLSIDPFPSTGNFDGEPVTGTFRLDTAGVQPIDLSSTDAREYFVPEGGVEMTFTTLGRTLTYGGPGDPTGSLFTFRQGGGYSFTFGTGGALQHANMSLVGDLIDSLDIGTLHHGTVDLAKSSTDFFTNRELGAKVKLESFEFSVQAIPEPGTWLMLLSGLGVLAWRSRRATLTVDLSCPNRSC